MTRQMYTIDPGGADLGWAFWDDGVLLDCGLSRCKAKTWQDRARHHREFLGLQSFEGTILTECMRVRGGRNMGNPQILVELNGIAGHVGNDWVEAGVWKGNVPKEVHQPRILATLDEEELALIEKVLPASKRHNTIDAVGIGLWFYQRLVPQTTRIRGKK